MLNDATGFKKIYLAAGLSSVYFYPQLLFFSTINPMEYMQFQFKFVPLEKIKFCQIIRPVYVKYALAFLWTILQECPYMGKN